MNYATPYSPILYLEENTKGNDYVVGDIHGAFTLLLHAMDLVGFNPDTDRLLSVGDLIDRGPESARVARFLDQPYVYAIRGNHEDLLVELCEEEMLPSIPDSHYLIENIGLGWWNTTPEPVRLDIVNKLRSLPVVIELKTVRGTVGLVHADVPAGLDWKSFKKEIEAGNKTTIETAMWGRTRHKHSITSGVKGIDRLFVGHNVQENGPRRLGNVYLIDTGAIFAQMGVESTQLTIMNVLHSSRSLAPKANSLVSVFNSPDHSRKFGNYSMWDIFSN